MVAPSLGVSLKRNFQKQRDTSRRFPAASLGSKPGSFSASGSFPGPSSSSKPHLTCTLILTQPRKLLHRTYHTFSHFEFLLLPNVSFFLLFPPFSSFFLFLQQRSQAQTGQTNATAVHPQSPELLAGGQGAQPLRSQASNGEMENQTSNGCANWPRAGCFREEGVGLMVSLVLPRLGQCPSSKIDSGKIGKEP